MTLTFSRRQLADYIIDHLIGRKSRTELSKNVAAALIATKNKKETDEVLRDGWLHTGDIGKMDDEGYFFIVDRKKDMIISGGYNVYPRDIEEVFYENPKIQEACAIGIPHAHRGEAVKVFVVLKEGETATQDELLAYCQNKLAKFKLPTEIEFRIELPKTNVGKILKGTQE